MRCSLLPVALCCWTTVLGAQEVVATAHLSNRSAKSHSSRNIDQLETRVDEHQLAQRFLLRIATFNVDGDSRDASEIDSIGRALSGADIVALNEVYENQATRIAKIGGFPYTRVADRGAGITAIAVLSRYPVIDSTVRWYPVPWLHPRYANFLFLRVRLRVGSTPLTLFSTRLVPDASDEYRGGLRLKEAQFLDSLVRLEAGPVVVAGDLNEPSDSAAVRLLTRRNVDAFVAAAPPKDSCTGPNRKDYILFRGVDRYYKGMSHDVKISCFGLYSDHPVVVANIGGRAEVAARRVLLRVEHLPSGEGQSSIIVRATDFQTREPVHGDVQINGIIRGRTNAPITYTPTMTVFTRRWCEGGMFYSKDESVAVETSSGLVLPAAVYQVTSFTPAPRLLLRIQCVGGGGAPNRPRRVQVEASDAVTLAPVRGLVFVNGRRIGFTGDVLSVSQCEGATPRCQARVWVPGYPSEQFEWP